jgi:hypothetical protein
LDQLLKSTKEIPSKLMVGHSFEPRFVTSEIGCVKNDVPISKQPRFKFSQLFAGIPSVIFLVHDYSAEHKNRELGIDDGQTVIARFVQEKNFGHFVGDSSRGNQFLTKN